MAEARRTKLIPAELVKTVDELISAYWSFLHALWSPRSSPSPSLSSRCCTQQRRKKEITRRRSWLYVRNYISMYAGLASVMIALVFLYTLGAIFVFGGELNAAIVRERRKSRRAIAI